MTLHQLISSEIEDFEKEFDRSFSIREIEDGTVANAIKSFIRSSLQKVAHETADALMVEKKDENMDGVSTATEVAIKNYNHSYNLALTAIAEKRDEFFNE